MNVIRHLGWKCDTLTTRIRAEFGPELGKPLAVDDVTLDPPSAGEVRVKIVAYAVCYSEIHYTDGVWDTGDPAILGHQAFAAFKQGEALRNVVVF